MQRYRVATSSFATEKIADYAAYIVKQSGSLEVAERWIDRVHEAIDGLNFFPHRFELAEEDAHCDYEVRRVVIGNYLALYNIDEGTKTVRVIGFRHGARLPRPDDLPTDLS
jgi:toxin ParE1/3/4